MALNLAFQSKNKMELYVATNSDLTLTQNLNDSYDFFLNLGKYPKDRI